MNLQPGSAPIYMEVASLIAPADVPPWLPTMLSDWAPSLSVDRGVHAIQPTKSEMRKRLTEVIDAAASLLRAVQDTPTKEFLEHEGWMQMDNIGGLLNALGGISQCATVALASPRISATSTTAVSGRGRALPTKAYSPKTFCAVIISEVWKYLRGAYPAPRNVDAAKAAAAYWQASGGVTDKRRTASLDSWRYHFKQANLPTAEKERRDVRRHCVEHSHEHQLFSAAS